MFLTDHLLDTRLAHHLAHGRASALRIVKFLINTVSLGPMATNKTRDSPVIIDVPEDGEDNYGVSTSLDSGMQITFRNLVYQVKNKQNKKEETEILHGLSGFFNPSQMTAVMGPRFV